MAGEIAGTPAYMSPEQIEGTDVSVRSDVYALGLVLYEIFTGKQAFKADSVHDILRMHRETPPAKPSSHVSDLDPRIERLILRCLEKEPVRFHKQASDRLARWHHPAPFQPAGFLRRSRIDSSPLVPGEVALRLDPLGKVVEFQAVPPRIADPEDDAASVDWTTLFAEMGLDVKGFEPVAPTLTPSVYADTRAAWRGSYSGAMGIPIRVEAAALRGRVVSSRIIGPWNLGGVPPFSLTGADFIMKGLAPWFFLALAGGSAFAVRNLRLRRGDRPGAFRIAAVVLAAGVLTSALGTHDCMTVAQAWHSVSAGVGAALWNAGVVWVLYMAIEPYVRRHWPETLISWSRLLAGRFRDPRVGRDVLFGVVCLWLLIAPLFTLCFARWKLPGFGDLECLSGPRHLISKLLAGLGYSIVVGLGVLVVVLLLRVVVRWHWAAVGATGALMVFLLAPVAQFGREDIVPILALGAIMATLLLLITRVGLLAFVVMHILAVSFAYELPVTLDLSAWYGHPTLLFLLVVAVLTLLGFYVSLGGRPMFREKFLEE